jgi:hypothetical protein
MTALKMAKETAAMRRRGGEEAKKRRAGGTKKRSVDASKISLLVIFANPRLLVSSSSPHFIIGF